MSNILIRRPGFLSVVLAIAPQNIRAWKEVFLVDAEECVRGLVCPKVCVSDGFRISIVTGYGGYISKGIACITVGGSSGSKFGI